MELIFYPQAADLLGVKVDTLRHAVSRGDLTRGPRKGHSQSLIREQVMLFTSPNPRTGKKRRLSYDALTPAEQEAWKRYAGEITTSTPVRAEREDIKAMVQQEVSEQGERLEEAFANFLMQMGLQFRDQIRPALRQNREVPQGGPFPMRNEASRAS